MSMTITAATGMITTSGVTARIIGEGFTDSTRFIISNNVIPGGYIAGETDYNSATMLHIYEPALVTNDTTINFSLTGGVSYHPVVFPAAYRPSGSASGDVLYMTYLDSGTTKLIKSIDQGQTWTEIYSYGSSLHWTETNYASHRQGIIKTNKTGSYAAFSNAKTYEESSIYSTDGGSSWNDSAINYIMFVNETGNIVYGSAFLNEGTVIGGTEIPMTNWWFVKSDDYGETISKVFLTAPEPMYNRYMSSLDCSIMYCVKDSKLYKTTNGGDLWDEVVSAGDRIFLTDCCMSDNASVIFVSYEETNSGIKTMHVLRSVDSGNTWSTCFTNDYYWPCLVSCNPTGQLASLITKTYAPWFADGNLEFMAFISVDYGGTFLPKSTHDNVGFGTFQPYINSDGTLVIGAGKFDGTNDPNSNYFQFISYSYDYMDLIESTINVTHPVYRLYITNDFGQTWQLKYERTADVLNDRYDLSSTVISNDGSKLIFFSNDGNMYTNLTSGDIWTATAFDIGESYIDRWSISADAACDYIILADWNMNMSSQQTLYCTQDSGESWEPVYNFLLNGARRVSDMSCDSNLQIALVSEFSGGG